MGGELNPDWGAEFWKMGGECSSQSFPFEFVEQWDATEPRRLPALSFLDLGLSEGGETPLVVVEVMDEFEAVLEVLFLRILFPARSSSKRCGRGRRCVRSYNPHLLQTILPGLRVDRRQLGGSVVEQLKHRRRRYWVSLDAASSVCITGMRVWPVGGGAIPKSPGLEAPTPEAEEAAEGGR